MSFEWTSNGQIRFGDSLVSALSPSTFTAQLFYLGTDSAWTAAKILADGVDTTGETAMDSPVTSVSGKSGIFASQNSKFSGSTENGVANNTYGVLLTYVDGNGAKWFNISTDTYTVPSSADALTTGLSKAFTFSSAKNEVAAGSAISPGSGWYTATSVPEPGVAAMVLLGLGMLIKRRRA